MNEVFIWLSGLRFIDKFFILMARNFFRIFTENKPVLGLRKKYNIPDVNWLSKTFDCNCLSLPRGKNGYMWYWGLYKK